MNLRDPIQQKILNMNDDSPDPSQQDIEPEFGLLDIVKAFTALRHELRTQTRENRQLADAVLESTKTLQTLESKLTAGPTDTHQIADRPAAVDLIIEVEQRLQRAIEAARQRPQLAKLEQTYKRSPWWRRWLSRGLYRDLRDGMSDQSDPVLEGLQIMHKRLHDGLPACQLERIETTGQAFDPQVMKAISSIHSESIAAGHVVEQVSPAWRYQGQIIRFAEVRVSIRKT